MDQLNYDISTTIFIVREYYRKSNNRAICTLQMVEEVKEQNEEKEREIYSQIIASIMINLKERQK